MVKSESLCYVERFDGKDPLDVLRAALALFPTAHVVLEDVHAQPGQGVVSMFTFGVGLGRIQGFLKALGVSYVKVSPQAWQKWLPEAETPKGRVRSWAFAAHGERAFVQAGCRVAHQGMMDAAAMAAYWGQICQGTLKPPAPRAKVKRLRPLQL